jgi:hypothetical protein
VNLFFTIAFHWLRFKEVKLPLSLYISNHLYNAAFHAFLKNGGTLHPPIKITL